jgi:hypothetical protein
MRKGLAVAAVLVVGTMVYLCFRSAKSTPQAVAPMPPELSTVASASVAGTRTSGPATVLSQAPPQQPAPQAGQLIIDSKPPSSLPPEIALRNVGHAIHEYGEMFNGNPVGTNPEITSQLNGNNPKHVNFVDSQAGMRINANGELVDAWGTPYFFHQISSTEMEIHSAGPDKMMWTSDDLVAK